ncbi:hypothetical protein ABMV07_07605 [Corynebacterium belfantii]|uniref:hypothetical protein n=1 Tax=Corynebacterium belfantii TaxID=2014537 RepID=UPI000963D1CC|nr:hypothetical protein BUE64_08920 [Corynebacterium diphtheriae subsp. lausannense]QBZ30208.1 hypothetical protein E4653_10640 [Corynebacterium diphtheriae subsp. lausannense]
MKLFSRKGLVAATTAVAISAGSLSAPAMADAKPNDGSSFSQIIDAGSTGASKTDKNKPKTDDVKTDANKTIAQIKSVLNIISTVIAILGALFPLASQIMKKFGI